jgi:hypothetical protein
VPDPLRVARVFQARRQPLGDLEPPFNRRQQQYSAIRGQPAAVETDMHRLAGNGWQTRQNPHSLIHGGRKLRRPRLDPAWQPNHTRNQRVNPLPPPLSANPDEFSGLTPLREYWHTMWIANIDWGGRKPSPSRNPASQLSNSRRALLAPQQAPHSRQAGSR